MSDTLKHLFTAFFKDGTSIKQTQEDLSTIEQGRSAFFDVLENHKNNNEVIRFELTDGANVYAVDLQDGHFEVNGVKFFVHDSATTFYNKRVVFFRRHYHTMISGSYESGHRVVYILGWQANETEDPTSANKQFTIEFD